jgi:hypothetical protein
LSRTSGIPAGPEIEGEPVHTGSTFTTPVKATTITSHS